MPHTESIHEWKGLVRCSASGAIQASYKAGVLRNACLATARRYEGGRFRSWTLRYLLYQHHGVHVGAYSYGGSSLTPGGLPMGVSIGRYVSLAAGLRILQRNHTLTCLSTHPFFFNAKLGMLDSDSVNRTRVRIEHDAWIGENVIMTPKCSRIGLGAIVGAGSVVTRDVPDFAIVAGNPARLIRWRFADSTMALVRDSQWWDHTIEELREFMPHMMRELDASPSWHPLLSGRAKVVHPRVEQSAIV